MIVFLKRHLITFASLFLGLMIGLIVYVKEPPIDIWLIEYEFDTDNELNLEPYEQADTVFQYKDLFCRNYISSVGDTLKEDGIRRHELKIYIPQDSKLTEAEASNEILVSPYVRIVKNTFRETQKNRQKILYWVLFGLFIGITVELVFRLKKNPSAN